MRIPLRGAYYQWLVYCPATLEPAIGLLNQHTVNLPPEQRYEPIVEKSRARLTDSLALLERTLAERPFLVDDRFSTADLIVASNLRWASRSNLLHGVPRLSAWLDQMLARSAALRVFAP